MVYLYYINIYLHIYLFIYRHVPSPRPNKEWWLRWFSKGFPAHPCAPFGLWIFCGEMYKVPHVSSIFKPWLSGQILATSHDLTPKGSWEREITLFQGNLAWWNIIIWPDDYVVLWNGSGSRRGNNLNLSSKTLKPRSLEDFCGHEPIPGKEIFFCRTVWWEIIHDWSSNPPNVPPQGIRPYWTLISEGGPRRGGRWTSHDWWLKANSSRDSLALKLAACISGTTALILRA